MFTPRTARRTARRYRRRGLLARERDLVEPVVAAGVVGATVFEIGGGVGQLQLALLDRGAVGAANLELSEHYEDEADALARAGGHEDRVVRFIGDAGDPPEGLPSADVALLYRTICCTDDWRGMIDTALASGARTLGVTFPKEGIVPTVVGFLENGFRRTIGSEWRMRHHDNDEVMAYLEAASLQVVHDHSGIFWRTVVLTR